MKNNYKVTWYNITNTCILIFNHLIEVCSSTTISDIKNITVTNTYYNDLDGYL